MLFERLESRAVLTCDPLTAPLLAGDVNGDGAVGFDDFLELSKNFDTDGVHSRSDGDLNGDGEVGFGDFLILSKEFGNELVEDINGDGKLDLDDAHELRDDVLTNAEYDASKDLNADGLLNAMDVTTIAHALRARYPSHPADINLDCILDEADFKQASDNLGQQVIGGWIDGDLDRDGGVDFTDLLRFDPSPF